tara:strand:- start:251 stop:481 length:231 start_codon:yes stop_codon:yes gene_type:complete
MGVRVTPPSTIKVQVGSTSQPRVTSLSYGGSFALKNATDLSMLGAQDGDVIVYKADTNSFIIQTPVSVTNVDGGEY